MGAFDKLMSNPFFGAGIGILQGQTPSRTRPNFAANAMGGLQNAMANRTSIQNQSQRQILFLFLILLTALNHLYLLRDLKTFHLPSVDYYNNTL